MKVEKLIANTKGTFIDITNRLTNDEIIQKGEEYNVMGTNKGILFDGDFEEFLADSGIEIAKMNYVRDVEYLGCGISNFTEGEYMGYCEVRQNENSQFFTLFSSREMAEVQNVFIDFSIPLKILRGKTIA